MPGRAPGSSSRHSTPVSGVSRSRYGQSWAVICRLEYIIREAYLEYQSDLILARYARCLLGHPGSAAPERMAVHGQYRRVLRIGSGPHATWMPHRAPMGSQLAAGLSYAHMRTSQRSPLSTLMPSLCTGNPHAYRGSVRSRLPVLQVDFAEALDAWRKGKEMPAGTGGWPQFICSASPG